MTDQISKKAGYMRDLIARIGTDNDLSESELERETMLLLEWIRFFQHERLIHLIVTVLFAILTFGSFATLMITQFLPIIAVFVLFMILLVPYIFHYYQLENGVQKLYGLYEELVTARGMRHG
jgi:hypothetical protein